MRAQPEPVRPTCRAGAGEVGRLDALRGAGAGAVPRHHRGALRRHPAALRVPVVRPGPGGEARNDGRARPGPAHADGGVARVARGSRRRATIVIERDEVLVEGRPGPARHRGPRRGAGGPTWWWDCGEWPTSRTSSAPARRRRSACSTTRKGSPSAPTRCATRNTPPCCWPRCAASRPVPDRWRSCVTTTTPRCSIAATGATSSSSRGSRGAAARRRSHGCAGRIRLQPRRGAAGALDVGGRRPRGGARAVGRSFVGVGAWP